MTTGYAYDALGNLVCKSDLSACSATAPNLAYGAQVVVGGVTRTLPHAVKSVAGTVHGVANPVYGYDATGAMLSGAGRSVSYNAAGLTAQITAAGKGGVAYAYGPEHQRVRENQLSAAGAVLSSTYYLHPDSANGLFYEVSKGAATQHRHYVSAGGQVVAMVTFDGTTWTPKYMHRDALDSVVAVTDAAGAVLERLAYDPWGQRRQANGVRDPLDQLAGVNTDRGYTNHEHIDGLGLVNMNGRVFDPALARFMAADPLVQAPHNLQSYNRYAYALNNPLILVDPSGYSSLGSVLFGGGAKKVVETTFKLHHSLPTQAAVDRYVLNHHWAYVAGNVAASYFGGPLGSAVYTSYYSYVGTGDINRAMRDGTTAFVTAVAFNVVGSVLPGTEQPFANALGHAAVGCASAAANGGSCRAGALSAGVPAAFGNYFPEYGNHLAVQMAVGGTASVLGGGKFANGALTAAYGYLFNYCAHNGNCTTKLEQFLWDWMPGYKLGTCINVGNCTAGDWGLAAGDTALAIGGGALGKGAPLAVDAVGGAKVAAFSLWDTSITAAGARWSTVATDVTATQFQNALMTNGYRVIKQEIGSNGPVTVLNNGVSTYTIYVRSSTGGAGAQLIGANGLKVKYSLGGP